MEERARHIIVACLQEKSQNPVEIFLNIAQMDLETSLNELMKRGLQMPGATCGMWGVCGAVSSMGASLSIIDGTGPLSTDTSWGKHMEFTSKALHSLSQVGGPRCCKRDAFFMCNPRKRLPSSVYTIHAEARLPKH